MGLMALGGNVVRLGTGTISVSAPDPEIYISPTGITNISYLGATCPVTVCGNKNNCVTVADACTWIVTTTPVIPSVAGTINNIQICENITSSCRSAVVCYTPSLGGAMKCVTLCQGTGDTNIYLSTYAWTGACTINGGGANFYEYVCGPISNSTSFATSCTWIHATTPVSPCASPGRAHLLCVDTNTGVARSGTACYTPTCGTMRTITICQNEAPAYVDMCFNGNYPTNGTDYYSQYCAGMCESPAQSSGSYCACFQWYLYKEYTLNAAPQWWCIMRNSVCVCGCYVSAQCVDCWGTAYICFDYNDTICIMAYAQMDTSDFYSSYAQVGLTDIVSNQSSPCYCLGSTCTSIQAYTCP